MTARCISGYVPPIDKIPKAVPMFSRVSFSHFNGPVSYTHLTLPTIYSV